MRWFDAVCRPGGSSNRGRELHRNRHGDADPEVPPGYHRASGLARKSAAATRRPAYVNPTNGNLLDIYVDGVLVTGLGGLLGLGGVGGTQGGGSFTGFGGSGGGGSSFTEPAAPGVSNISNAWSSGNGQITIAY